MINPNSTSLVQNVNGEPVTTSLIVAEHSDNQHASVIRLIRVNQADFEAFAGVRFEIQPFETAGGTQRREVAYLNEPQATLLITYLRNTEKVRALKVALVKEFYAMRQMLTAQTFDPNSLSRSDILRLALEAEEEKKVLEAALESAAPAIEYHDRYVANSDTATIEDWGRQYGLTRNQAFDLLRGKDFIFKKSMGKHFSNKKGCVIEEFEHRARQGKVTYAFFTQLPHNKVDRHYNGQVRQTLYVRQAYAIELAKACGLVKSEVMA